MPRDFLDRFKLSEQSVVAGGKDTILLNDRHAAWLVETGQAEIFAVPGNQEMEIGRRFHLLSLQPNEVLFGIDQDCLPEGLQLLVSGVPGTQLREISTQISNSNPSALTMVHLLENWLIRLTAAVIHQNVPADFVRMVPAEEYQVSGTQHLGTGQEPLWVKTIRGKVTWLGNSQNEIATGTTVLVSTDSWLEADDGACLEIWTTQEWFDKNPQPELDNYYVLLFKHWTRLNNNAILKERLRFHNKIAQQQGAMKEALFNLAAAAGSSSQTSYDFRAGEDHLWTACRCVGEAANINILALPPDVKANPSSDPLEDIVKVSRIRMRQVVLKGKWWHLDNGPLLAYLEDDRPVALLPAGTGSCELYDPANQTKRLVDRILAGQIKPFAYTFYRTFPAKVLQVKDLIQFAGKSHVRRDLWMVLLMGILGGLLNLAIPVATGKLIDTVIPQAESGQLGQMTFILIICMLAAAMFELTRSIALLRFEGRVNADLEGAVWDRLINLPAPFFRQFSVGDLTNRANSINAIRKILSGITITAIISGIFSSFNFFLLFVYDVQLALMALVVLLAAIAFTALFGWLQVHKQQELAEREGKIQGLVLQLIRGIAKFGVAGAETKAFALWSHAFGEVRKVSREVRQVANYLTTFNAVLPVIASLILYAAAGTAADGRLTTGNFLAFYSAFTTLIIALTATTRALITGMNVVPLYRRARPILETLPEIDEAKAVPGKLKGDIEVNHVYFRYTEDGPNILNDVSLNIKPGEFVAVVGSSGSGKSTLLRLLLGFEQAQAGTIYYDGQDLSQLDLRAVRNQLGVVLQNSQLMIGDIFSNIVGSKPLTIKDAEEAARMAGLDEDIRHMPMGMHTIVSEGGGTLSGGQRQRLLIARAIVNKPRIIFFDEATSALDNQTQAIVSRSLEGLKATRVVIAHRLSTIINADRIIVMDQGRVVQTGNYKELIRQEGLFAELAKRQLA